jgi:hypothetical protein
MRVRALELAQKLVGPMDDVIEPTGILESTFVPSSAITTASMLCREARVLQEQVRRERIRIQERSLLFMQSVILHLLPSVAATIRSGNVDPEN